MMKQILASIRNELAMLERYLSHRVEIRRVVLAPAGRVLRHIHRGWVTLPHDWQPPTEEVIAKTKTKGR